MPKFIADFFPNVANYWDIFLTALTATYQMFFIAGLITLLIGCLLYTSDAADD